MKNLSRALLLCVVLIVISAGCIGQNPAPHPATPVPESAPTAQPTPDGPACNSSWTTCRARWVVTTMAIQGGTTILQPTAVITLAFQP